MVEDEGALWHACAQIPTPPLQPKNAFGLYLIVGRAGLMGRGCCHDFVMSSYKGFGVENKRRGPLLLLGAWPLRLVSVLPERIASTTDDQLALLLVVQAQPLGLQSFSAHKTACCARRAVSELAW